MGPISGMLTCQRGDFTEGDNEIKSVVTVVNPGGAVIAGTEFTLERLSMGTGVLCAGDEKSALRGDFNVLGVLYPDSVSTSGIASLRLVEEFGIDDV